MYLIEPCACGFQIIEAMPHTNMVAEFVEKLGSFYELVDDKLTVNGSVVHENSGNTMNGAEPVPTETSFGKGSPDSEPSSGNHYKWTHTTMICVHDQRVLD